MKRENKALYEQIMKTVAKQVKKALNENKNNLSAEEEAIEKIKQLFKIFKPDFNDIDTDPEDGCTVDKKDGTELFITRVVYNEEDDKLDIYGAFTEPGFYEDEDEYSSKEELYYNHGRARFNCSEFDLDGLDSLFYITRNGMYWYKDDNMTDEEFYRITDNI